MGAVLRMPVDPALERAGFFKAPEAISDQLDARAFVIIETRAQAEHLIEKDFAKAANDTVWTAFFVESLVEFLVWQNQPCGQIAESDLDWFLGLVSDAPSPSIPALLFALVRELNSAPERLIAMAMKHSANRLAGQR